MTLNPNPLKWKLHWQIAAAILLAVGAGLWSGAEGRTLGIHWFSVYDFVGRIFLNALKMLIIPLIVSSIIVGIAGIAKTGRLGMLGLKTFGFYFLTMFLAVLVGLAFVNMTAPGYVNGEPAGAQLALTTPAAEISDHISEGSLSGLTEIFVRAVPENVVAAAANMELLSLIVFALLFGFFMARIEHPYAETMYNFWEATFQVMMKITGLVMAFAPIGVFGLVAKVVATTGFDGAGPLLLFAVTVTMALLFHLLVTNSILVKLIAGVSPMKLFRAMSPALLTAFSTASSMATLPMTIRCLRENTNVSQRTTSFVVPLGATINMSGTALYECVAAMFIAQAYGLELTFTVQIVIVVAAVVTSLGVAGVPAASMVAIGIILTVIGLPLEALGVLFVFDRILDMMRTSVNIYGDGVCAVIVAKLEGEKDLLP